MDPRGVLDDYFDALEKRVREAYDIAERARKKGLDPELQTEIPLAKDLAGRVEGLVGPRGVADRIRELSGEGKEIVALRIAGEIAEGKFDSHASAEERCLQALRTSLAILTEGVVAAPLEGIIKVKIKRNNDGSKYLAVYFAGPIRSAGGSEQALVVLTADYVRRILGLDRYKPTDEEVERFVEEVELYNAEAVRLQYLPTPQEVREAVRHIPVEITGESTDKVEVSGYRDLDRIETNQVRGGAILVLAGGVLQKKPKIRKYVEKLKLEGWEWMLSGAHAQQRGEESAGDVGPNPKYMRDLIAGRPVISHPSAKGGLRLRYGRCRNSGYAATCMHPATLFVLDDFIAIGTQIKTERPGKGSAVAVCDSIEGPIIKLADGSVVRVESAAQGERLKGEVREVLFVGDILIGYGEFLENNHRLMPSGYAEEWWLLELEKAGGISSSMPSQEEAIALSDKHGVPIHPRYTYFYHDAEKEDLKKLALWLATGEIRDEALMLENAQEKEILEFLCVPHRVKDGRVILEEYKPLLRALGMADLSIDAFLQAYERAGDSMELVNSFGVKIRAKAPTYIGARMGRPEKAKERRMKPPVNVLFPVGQAGGRTRDVTKAAEIGVVRVDIARRCCTNCGVVTHLTLCPKCGGATATKRACIACGIEYKDERERCRCGARIAGYEERGLNIKELLEKAVSRAGEFSTDLKGVIGMSSEAKIPEPLEKGILRSRHGVYVFKDGTIRFDATDMPITHFKPAEIGVGLELLKGLGYDTDWKGRPLESEDQLLELRCQDVILPESGADYLLRASQFVDELLVKLYGLEPYYSAEAKGDLIGHLVLGLAPHTSAAVLGRIIGFTKVNVGLAHPFFHAAKRRNCDGDEDSIFLLMDALLNFSKAYLPATRGGMMDAPLVLTTRLDPREIDDEAHNMDVAVSYPLEFYEATLRYAQPKEVKKIVEVVGDRVGKPEQYLGLGFTHDTSDIAQGTRVSSYKTLASMMEKVERQLELAKKLRAVDQRDVAKRVVESHFLPDLAGNLRTFSKQTIRCVGCNSKYRRVPLSGKCRKCGGKLVLTVSKGGVEKYLTVTKDLIEKYGLDDYLRQRVRILEASISAVFVDQGRTAEQGSKQVPGRQVSLSDFAK